MIHQNNCCLSRSGIITGILIALLLTACVLPVLAETGSPDAGFTVSGQQLSAPPEDQILPGDKTGADDAGMADVVYTSESGDRAWRFDVDTSTFKPDEYIVTATAVVEDATGTMLFSIVETSKTNINRIPQVSASSSPPGTTGYYITIDPIGDRYAGEKITITGRTNLPEGAEMLVQVYSSSFKPTQKSQGGEFSGATGTVSVSDSGIAVAALSPLKKDAGTVDSNMKIIRTGSVTLEVEDVTGAVAALQELASAQGGYLSSSSVQGSGNRHTGTVVLRVPQARFETTLAGVKSSGTVKSFSTQGEDVTEEYIDLEAQKKSCQVQLAQYYVLMKKAVKVADIIAIQQQIDRVQTELNRLEGRLKYLDSRIDLSTITITLQDPEPEPVHTETGHNFVSAFSKGIEGLCDFIDSIIITVITFLPLLAVAVIGYIVYRIRKGRRPVQTGTGIVEPK
ncbi:MAG: DUF4349 domain-containing protein [Methanoregula sp.]